MCVCVCGARWNYLTSSCACTRWVIGEREKQADVLEVAQMEMSQLPMSTKPCASIRRTIVD